MLSLTCNPLKNQPLRQYFCQISQYSDLVLLLFRKSLLFFCEIDKYYCRFLQPFLKGIFVIMLQQNVFAGEFNKNLIIMPLGKIKVENQIEWLDNNRIVFTGSNPEYHEGTSVFRWNIPSQVEYIFGGIRRICLDGENLYALGKADTNELKRFLIAPPDYSTASLLERSSASSQPTFFDNRLCMERSTPKILLGRTWKNLSKTHGYLDFGPLQPTGESIIVTIVSEDGISRRNTSLILENPILPYVVYVPHKEAYFVHNLNLTQKERQQWSDGGYLDTWFIRNDGEVATIKIPSGDWVSNQGTILILSLPKGFVIVAQGFERNGDPGSAGAYLIHSDGRSERLISGFVANPRVSPNGCRLAFAFQQRFDSKMQEGEMTTSYRKLMVMNICK